MKHIDKLLHALCNMVIVLALSDVNIWVAFGVAVVASIGKEVVDQIRYKGWSWFDLLADEIGMAIALVWVIVFKGV